jgi:hypothetical protein
VRKIFSILVVLGLVLGMVVATAPAAAQGPGDWTIVGVTVDPNCEYRLATYNITFTTTASLTEGVHTVCVKFPEGTGYPETWCTGHIVMNGVNVFPSEITRTGDEVCFIVPIDFAAGAQWVAFVPAVCPLATKATGIKNPAPGTYFLYLKTSRAPNSSWVKSGWTGTKYVGYKIVPEYSSYKFMLDFSPTYPGLCAGFIPPFQACGQNDEDQPTYPTDVEPFDTWFDPAEEWWVTNFTTTLAASPIGCTGCDDMQKQIRLTSAPTGGAAHLYLDTTLEKTFKMTTAATRTYTWGLTDDLANNHKETFVMGLHFDTPGTYELCFDLIYKGPTVCTEYCQDYSICFEFVVHQWKEAYPIPLYRKWNLISLPLPCLTGTLRHTGTRSCAPMARSRASGTSTSVRG